jgi:hypothetical protein
MPHLKILQPRGDVESGVVPVFGSGPPQNAGSDINLTERESANGN